VSRRPDFFALRGCGLSACDEGRAPGAPDLEVMRISCSLVLAALVLPSLARALLLDHEPYNDSVSTAAIQLVPSAGVNVDVGRFRFSAGGGDTDFVGLGGLFAGDVVTVSTTPMVDAPNFEIPDTIVGIFDSSGTLLCREDDAFNNDLDDVPRGYGSLCRFQVAADGDYFVAATGWSLDPFDGNHVEEGAYTLTVTVTALPEPALPLQLAAGLLALATLGARRCGADGQIRRAPRGP